MEYKTEATPKAMAGEVPVFCAHDEIVEVEKLVPNPRNPNTHPEEQIALLGRIIGATGWRQPITVSKRSGFIVKGHGRLAAALAAGFTAVPVDYQEYDSEASEYADMVADNRLAELSEIDNAQLRDIFKDIDLDEIPAELTGYTAEEFDEILQGLSDSLNEDAPADLEEPDAPADLEEPDAPADLEEPVTQPGDVWVIGRHRLMCGDSTDGGAVAILANGQKADFIHADPPYGMGKVSDGVANDDKRREELVAFQMEWIKAFRLFTVEKINLAIWGNSEELWRLWYGGLNALEKDIRFANEIVWRKTNPAGTYNPVSLSLPPSERCLIVQTGEQFLGSVNSEYFPEEWRPILEKLRGMADAVGLTAKKVKELTGKGMYSHWFTESQFTLIPLSNYETLREAYPEAFTAEWVDLKQEWDEVKSVMRSAENRVYFDATITPTDVLETALVLGNDRPDYPTPKHLEIMKAMVKMCCPAGGLVLEPFSGSGQTLLACEATGRTCYSMELQPKYVDMGVRRWMMATKSDDVRLIRNGEEQPREVFAAFFEDEGEA